MGHTPEDLSFELLRPTRAQLAALGRKVDSGCSTLSERRDALQTEVRGVNDVAAVSRESGFPGSNDCKARSKQLEKACSA